MSDFTVQAVSPESPCVLSLNTPIEFGSHPETLDVLLPWLTADGEPVYVQLEENEFESLTS